MTFEEKFAAQGRKMDELKLKLDDAVNARKLAVQKNREQIAADIAEMEAEIDAFNADVDAQVEKQMDTMSAQVEKQLDKQAEVASAHMERAEEKMEQGAAKAKAAFTLDKATAESIANEPTGIDGLQKQTAGDFAALEEDVRLLRGRREAKFSNAKLRTQMKVDAAKEKVLARKEAVDKAAQEAWIADLLDYADGCYEMAYAWALEAEYTLMEAAYELNDYLEKYGDQ